MTFALAERREGVIAISEPSGRQVVFALSGWLFVFCNIWPAGFPHPVADRFFRSSLYFATVFDSVGLQAWFSLSGWQVGFAPLAGRLFFHRLASDSLSPG